MDTSSQTPQHWPSDRSDDHGAVSRLFRLSCYNGDYGIYSKYRLETRIAEAQERLDALVAKRQELEHRVALVNDGSLEKDMLDEQARRALNLARENEVIVLIGAGQ